MNFLQFLYIGVVALWTITVIVKGQKIMKSFFEYQNQKKDKAISKISLLIGERFAKEIETHKQLAFKHHKDMLKQDTLFFFLNVFCLTFFLSVTRNVIGTNISPFTLLTTFVILSIILPIFVATYGYHKKHDYKVSKSEQLADDIDSGLMEIKKNKGLEKLMKDLFPEDVESNNSDSEEKSDNIDEEVKEEEND